VQKLNMSHTEFLEKSFIVPKKFGITHGLPSAGGKMK
jgi:hypothetical protein